MYDKHLSQRGRVATRAIRQYVNNGNYTVDSWLMICNHRLRESRFLFFLLLLFRLPSNAISYACFRDYGYLYLFRSILVRS